MAYDLEEQEQLEQVKAFWAKWGSRLTGFITVAALGVTAYYGYRYYQKNEAAKATPLFEQLEKAASDLKADPKNPQLVADLATRLTQDYGNTAQAQLGAMLAAKTQADLGKQAEADVLYQWLIDHAKDSEYQDIARLNLAASLIDAKKAEQALAILPATAPKGFEVLYADRRGDALVAGNKKPEAIAEYQKAWTLAEKSPSMRELIDFKMQGLGAEVIKPAAIDKAIDKAADATADTHPSAPAPAPVKAPA